ncbi:MAG: hypothetical protein Q4C58_00795 [Eubacteriales bacterium]|nr:hypothetical protein [Eubacteriales bacterium]
MKKKSWIPLLVLTMGVLIGGCVQVRVVEETEVSAEEQETEFLSEKAETEEEAAAPEDAEVEAAPQTETEDETAAEPGRENGISAAAGYEDLQTVLVERPAQDYYLAEEPEKTSEHTLKLTKTFEKANAITDEEGWFDANQLDFPTYVVPYEAWGEAGNVPDEIPVTYEGLSLTQLSYDDTYFYCLYGENDYWSGYVLNLCDRWTYEPVYSLDFSNYRYGEEFSTMEQRIWWPKVQDQILYVSVGHGTYSESEPHHAYIVAVDLSDRSILWKTEPLVSNAYNFEIIGNEIVCGYGFTAEDDFLYQIDMDTGRILAQTPVNSMVYYIIRKDDALYVRTYNTNYVFQIEGIQ